jgi:hypothetical protein
MWKLSQIPIFQTVKRSTIDRCCGCAFQLAAGDSQRPTIKLKVRAIRESPLRTLTRLPDKRQFIASGSLQKTALSGGFL